MTPTGAGLRHYSDAEARSDFELASAARTSSGTGSAFTVEDAMALLARLNVTASSGTTPTLDVRLETTVDGTNWYTVGSFAQKTANGNESKAFGPLGSQCRWAWTIAGATPSFTFTVDQVKARRGR